MKLKNAQLYENTNVDHSPLISRSYLLPFDSPSPPSHRFKISITRPSVRTPKRPNYPKKVFTPSCQHQIQYSFSEEHPTICSRYDSPYPHRVQNHGAPTTKTVWALAEMWGSTWRSWRRLFSGCSVWCLVLGWQKKARDVDVDRGICCIRK